MEKPEGHGVPTLPTPKSKPKTKLSESIEMNLVWKLLEATNYCPLCPQPKLQSSYKKQLPTNYVASLSKLLIDQNMALKDRSTLNTVLEKAKFCAQCTNKVKEFHEIMDKYKRIFNENWINYLNNCYGPDYVTGLIPFPVKEEKIEPATSSALINGPNSTVETPNEDIPTYTISVFVEPEAPADKLNKNRNHTIRTPTTSMGTSTTQMFSPNRHQEESHLCLNRPPSPAESTLTCLVDNPTEEYDYIRTPSPTFSTHTLLAEIPSSNNFTRTSTDSQRQRHKSKTSSPTSHKEVAGSSSSNRKTSDKRRSPNDSSKAGSHKDNDSSKAGSYKANDSLKAGGHKVIDLTKNLPVVRLERVDKTQKMPSKTVTNEIDSPPKRDRGRDNERNQHKSTRKRHKPSSSSTHKKPSVITLSDSEGDLTDSDSSVKEVSKKSKPFSLDCSKCSRFFETESTYRRHLKNHERKDKQKSERQKEQSKGKSPDKSPEPRKRGKKLVPVETIDSDSDPSSSSASTSTEKLSSELESDESDSDSTDSLKTVVIGPDPNTPKRKKKRRERRKTVGDFIFL